MGNDKKKRSNRLPMLFATFAVGIILGIPLVVSGWNTLESSRFVRESRGRIGRSDIQNILQLADVEYRREFGDLGFAMRSLHYYPNPPNRVGVIFKHPFRSRYDVEFVFCDGTNNAATPDRPWKLLSTFNLKYLNSR